MRRGIFCVWRESKIPKAARAMLLPVGPDPRVPMRQVYHMFRGDMTPDAVMKAAGSDARGQFYGHLYVGLYLDAMGTSDPRSNTSRLPRRISTQRLAVTCTW